MKKKNFNQRTCCITNKKFNKKNLVRICIQNNKLFLDKNFSLKGRGIYIYSFGRFDDEIIKKKIEKKTNITMDPLLFNELKNYIQSKRSE